MFNPDVQAHMVVSLLMLMAAQAATVANASFNPRAVELFERDWVLNSGPSARSTRTAMA